MFSHTCRGGAHDSLESSALVISSMINTCYTHIHARITERLRMHARIAQVDVRSRAHAFSFHTRRLVWANLSQSLIHKVTQHCDSDRQVTSMIVIVHLIQMLKTIYKE
jgi:hypothetical protein